MILLSKNPLLDKNYFLLWSGALVSKIGDKFYTIALAWWILQETKSPAIMGLMLVVSVLPGLLIGPFAGALIDKWPRKPMLIIPDLIRGLIVTGVAVLSGMGRLEIWHIITAAGVISLASAFFDPSVQAVIPQIVTEENIPKANALNLMVGGISSVIGPILGSVVIGLLGFTTVFLINGLSYLISGFFEGFMIIPYINKKDGKNMMILEDLKEGFRFLKNQRKMLIIIGIIGIAHFFIGGLFVTLPFLADNLTGKGVQNLGSLETILGAGLILGTLCINLNQKNVFRDTFLFVFMAIIGSCFFGMGLFKHFNILILIPYLGLIGIIGVGIANASVYWESLLQLNTPNHIAGRIFSLSNMIGNISMPVAYGLFGILFNQFSIVSILISSGLFLIGISLLLMLNYLVYR